LNSIVELTTGFNYFQVIITSYLFPAASFSIQRLEETLQALAGDKAKLVIDLSCRKKDNSWFVAMNKWQTITDFEINHGKLHHSIVVHGIYG
jgi:phosphoribosylformimino-5-aminoimidazole carboxamide ribotide isomerase